MESIFVSDYPISDSYSRQLDKRVAISEKPYGYDMSPPPADTGDYNTRAKESHVEYPRRSKRG